MIAHDYTAAYVVACLGTSDNTLHNGLPTLLKRLKYNDLQAGITRLKRELKHVVQERNTLKEVADLLASQRTMRTHKFSSSPYAPALQGDVNSSQQLYPWVKTPENKHCKDDQRLSTVVKHYCLVNTEYYGYRNIQLKQCFISLKTV